MTGADVKAIRDALGRTFGRHISQQDLGLALRLAPANAADTVRSWEDGKRDVTGPASVALMFMRECTDLSQHFSHEGGDDVGNMVQRLMKAEPASV